MLTKIEDLKMVIQQFSMISQELLEENEYLKKQLKDKESELRKVKADNKNDIYELNKRIQDVEDKRDSREKENGNLILELRDLNREKLELLSDNKKYKAKVEDLDARVKTLEKQLEASNSTVKDMLEKIFEKLSSEDEAAKLCMNTINNCLKKIVGDTEESEDEEKSEGVVSDNAYEEKTCCETKSASQENDVSGHNLKLAEEGSKF